MAEKAADGEDVPTELTFDFKYNETALYTSGAAYVVENGEVVKDVVYSANDDGTENFSAVLTGLDSASADEVNESMVVRPYITYSFNGNTVTVYGNTKSASLCDVASLVNTTELPDELKSYIESVKALAK